MNQYYIDNSKAKKGLFELMDNYNLTRKPNSPRLSKTHYNTAEMMLYLYACESKKNDFAFDNEGNIPGFHTKTISLAKYHRCSERCIQRQKKRLKELNIIVGEKRLGSKGLEIWFNPEIYKYHPWYKRKLGALKSRTNIGKEEGIKSIQEKINKLKVNALPHAQCDNLSPINKGTTRTNIIITTHVDKGITTINQQKNGVASQQGVEQKASTQQEHRQEHCKNGESASSGLNFKPETNGLKMSNKTNSGLGGRPILNVEKFWRYAQPILYPHLTSLSSFENAIILSNIYESIFKNVCKPSSEKENNERMVELEIRVVMASKWLKANPSFKLPPADWYFSPNNNGISFRSTKEWFANGKRRRIILKIKYEIIAYKKGKGPHQKKTFLELFLIHKKMVENLRDPKLEDQFFSFAKTAYK